MTEPRPVQVLQVIRTEIERRGRGTPDDPVRVVTQLWTMEGELVAEIDRHAPTHCNAIGHRVRQGADRCERCGATLAHISGVGRHGAGVEVEKATPAIGDAMGDLYIPQSAATPDHDTLGDLLGSLDKLAKKLLDGAPERSLAERSLLRWIGTEIQILAARARGEQEPRLPTFEERIA